MGDIIIILLLMIFNGLLSMAEAAVIASRRVRLQQQADQGDAGARAALKLIDEPNRFLSTVQIGITLIGIIAGVFGGATVAQDLAYVLDDIPIIAPYSQPLSFLIVIAGTTYLSLIIGELVPKRLALRYPERIAALVAQPMHTLSKITAPLVTLLTVSTQAVVGLLGVRDSDEPPVTEAEITAMIEQGVEAGVFVPSEHAMVAGVFRLGDRRVRSLMTPRTDIVWLDINDSDEVNERAIAESHFSRFPVCDGDLDRVLGIVSAKDLISQILAGQRLDLRAVLKTPLFVPETMTAPQLLDLFRTQASTMALVVGEYGGVEGLVTIHDLLEEIVGDVEEPAIVPREDGSWLLDGLLPVSDLKAILDIDHLPGEGEDFDTLGGFVMTRLGRIPRPADQFERFGYSFEVVDMDGNRVDKVLVSPLRSFSTEQPSSDSEP